jgi:hydroxyacylglutathione hydrolase
MLGCFVDLIPILSNNYVFAIRKIGSSSVVIVDPGEYQKVQHYIDLNQLKLEGILLTHHHSDHIDGVQELIEKNQIQSTKVIPIYAPEKNRNEIKFATNYLSEDDRVNILGFDWKVLELHGHTLGHIAYLNEELRFLFSGDVLFGLGCGRLFEGTPEQHYRSLNKLKALNSNIMVFCTHEYTHRNLEFCHYLIQKKMIPLNFSIENFQEYEKVLRAKLNENKPSVPLNLGREIKCNPFLLSESLEEFTNLRMMRNKF